MKRFVLFALVAALIPTSATVAFAADGNLGVLNVAICSNVVAEDSPVQQRPNVLFIISDDLNNDMGTYGRPEFLTPNIDRLAKEGLQFNRAYCQFPLCNPSRSSMLSGLYPIQTKIYGNQTPIRKKFSSIVTMPELFKKNGYTTTRIGKIFHYGVPGNIGTDGLDDPQSWDFVYNPIGRDKTEESDVITLVPGRYGAVLSWLSMESKDEDQTDGKGATEAIRLLKQFSADKSSQPFFLAFGLYRPHTPYVAPTKYFELYSREDIELHPIQRPREPAAAFASHKKEQDTMTNAQRKSAIQAYHASVTFMDAQVGRVMDTLDELGLRETTIVVFTSDHGYHLGEHGLWQKRSLFEQSARVPMIIVAPGYKKAIQTDSPSELVDLYPTLASLCGLDIPGHVVGIDLSPLLKKPKKALKEIAFTEERRNVRGGKSFKGYSIRTKRYRYTEWDGGNEGIQLFDHKKDPEEMNNLAGNPKAKKTETKMKALLDEKLATLQAKQLEEWK